MRGQLTFQDEDGTIIVERRDFDAHSNSFIRNVVEAVETGYELAEKRGWRLVRVEQI